ncbi:MAG: hypothetical protein BGO78_01430 [Chloroflexi bacterium 44-23]|nr:MAG: hypothetical protein BGO78_01430 [Chloroflexi bacterium 44-23]
MNQWIQNEDLDGSQFFLEGRSSVLVILIHGFTATTVEVRPLAEALFSQGFSISAPLLPGHNTTPEDLNSKKWQDWTDAVIDVFKIYSGQYKHIFIAGESMGGLIALYLASKYPQFKGLLLYSPAIRIKNLRFSGMIRIFKKFIRKKNYGSDDGVKPGELPWKGYRVNPTSAVFQLYKLQKVVEKRLGLIDLPTVIFQGKLDTTIDASGAKFILDEISSQNKELVLLENSGHCVILEKEHKYAFEKSIEFINKQLGFAVNKSD